MANDTLPLLNIPVHCGLVLRGFHCWLPPGSAAVYVRGSPGHCPRALWWCNARIPLPTTVR